ncbi:MAG TPA: hypothetical protein PKJ77_00055, partial [Thermodesulfobacteriota bacterium]|nr:hypothetical protein [Thermodesulfobacteriota bacterium]
FVVKNYSLPVTQLFVHPQFKSIPLTTGRDLEYTLLHEMIHAYESLIPQALQQYLVLFLYGKLSETFGTGELDRIIRTEQHCLAVVHDLLFLLKSLDLDLAMDLAPGAIIDYGSEEFFDPEGEG